MRPADTRALSYDLEYGSDALEIHEDAIESGDRVLIVDDLIATGGTARACVDLVEQLGGDIAGLGFVVELTFLEGRKRFDGHRLEVLIQYDE